MMLMLVQMGLERWLVFMVKKEDILVVKEKEKDHEREKVKKKQEKKMYGQGTEVGKWTI